MKYNVETYCKEKLMRRDIHQKQNHYWYRHLQKESGFTLLEVILAISILTIGLLAVASMQISAVQGNNFSRSVTESSDRLQDTIEELLATNFSGVTDTDGDGAAGLNDVNPTAAPPVNAPDWSGAFGKYQLYYNVAENWAGNETAGGKAMVGVNTIRVYVMWQERAIQKEHSFDFMRTTI